MIEEKLILMDMLFIRTEFKERGNKMKQEKKFKRYKNHIILNPEWVKQNHPETYDIITGKLKIKLIKLKKKVIK